MIVNCSPFFTAFLRAGTIFVKLTRVEKAQLAFHTFRLNLIPQKVSQLTQSIRNENDETITRLHKIINY